MSLNNEKPIPFLPGHQFSDPYVFNYNKKENFHKSQEFSVVNKINCEKTNYISEPFNGELYDAMHNRTPANLTYGQRHPPENEYIPRVQPTWLKYDRKVLRYSAYFQESVVESPNENYRIRKCLIYYYLNDGTIHVTEPRVENSGIAQGIFIKRQKIPRNLHNAGDYYTWQDFNLGMNINFFERVFRIVDCDDTTKEFYNYMGHSLNVPEIFPEDNFEILKLLKDAKINPPDTKEYKEYSEVRLGGGHPNNGLKKYLENDRKVLSFDVLWDDKSLEGGSNYYMLNFFLADDTVEVKEVKQSNSGKDPFPLLLRRGKLPKNPIFTHCPGMSLKKEEFYSPKDLICGNKIVIYSRECLICNCDEFTKKWYQANLGVHQTPLQLKQEKSRKFYQPIPPYNGFGYEEDSLGSVYSLQPKPPKKDINKMFTCDQYILRYESRCISENREENDRKYIISFFCGDDSIQVYLVVERNSGIVGGKTFERKKHKNPITNQYYVEKDFQIGEIIHLGVNKFQLMRADEFTHSYMKQRPNVFKEADISHIIMKLRNYANSFPNFDEFLVELMKKLDTNKSGFVEFDELCVGMKSLGFNLTYQELYTLMRSFDNNLDWKLSMQELYEGLGGKKV